MTYRMDDAPVPAYALATAAYNEEALIEDVIRSVIAQSLPPRRWVIVSDGSTDRTDEIVQDYASKYSFIYLERITESHPRNFAAQASAINRGFERCKGAEYNYIGNLDADITLEPEYFSRLLERFERDPGLGLSGGRLYEMKNGKFEPRGGYNLRSVPHGVQMFRRECLEVLGGYLPLPYGGPDWHIEVSARMKGWRVEPFPGCTAFHHRPTGTAGGLMRHLYRQGLMDYSLGSHPLFQVFKIAGRLPARPYVLGALVRLSGFALATCRREKRPVSSEFVEFLREEQMGRVRNLFSGRSEAYLRTRAKGANVRGSGVVRDTNVEL
jgi:glycosyltransferase involved in cell wall biosynthesis